MKWRNSKERELMKSKSQMTKQLINTNNVSNATNPTNNTIVVASSNSIETDLINKNNNSKYSPSNSLISSNTSLRSDDDDVEEDDDGERLEVEDQVGEDDEYIDIIFVN